jgi:DNA-binding NarL/FixJ family response regulator
MNVDEQPPTTTLLIVEDQELMRIGLKVSLAKFDRVKVVGEAGNGEEAISEALKLRPAVILMDVGLPIMDGIEATWKIKQALPHTKIVMFTSHDTPRDVMAALGAGADGYCLKTDSIDRILVAIDAVLAGQIFMDPSVADDVMRSDVKEGKLSKAEVEILELIRVGLTLREIANQLGHSEERVADCMRGLIEKFSNKEALLRARDENPKIHEWLTATEPPPGGTIFADKYLIEQELGSGGVGTVYKAKHLYINRFVALKVLQPDVLEDGQVIRSFQHEATAIANLNHPNIVSMYDFGITKENEPYLVMEFIMGKSLEQILEEEKTLSLPRFFHIFLQVLSGLIAAHAKQIIHCDLKPSNILCFGQTNFDQVKLADFGLAKMIPSSKGKQSQMTDSFAVSGTPEYMPPEHCAGRAVDERSDLYAVGCVMYEALTGRIAFQGASAQETFALHFEYVPPPMAYMAGRAFPEDLENFVAKMIKQIPDQRIQSALQAWDALSIMQSQYLRQINMV